VPRIRPGLRTTLAAVAAVTVSLVCVPASTGQPGAGGTTPTYLNASASASDRVNDLLSRMTLEEKVGQMVQIRLGKLRGDCQWTPGPLRDDCMQVVLGDNKVGSILSGGGDYPVPDDTPRAWAEMTNAIQRFALDHSRLKIPEIYGADGVHGHNNLVTATLFPHQIGIGATWDPQLAEQMGASTSRAMRATGVFWDFAPVSDISRDTRWGRYYETYSEDPQLAGALAGATVRGLEAGDGSAGAKLTATAKHFAGYSQPFNGHDRTPAFIPVRQLQDTFLPPFQSQVDAGVGTVMINSASVNGVPVTGSKYMITDQLRQRMGFSGVVISDWQDVRNLVDSYHVVADYPSAIALSVNAGLDMAMEPSNAADFTSGLLQVVHDGRVSQQRIDESVRRILKLKFDLGLFEHPFVNPDAADGIVNGADLDLARKAAAESTVLLRNDNTLPLSTSAHKLVVTGDSADSVQRQLGGWTVGWQGVPANGPVPNAVTVLAGIKQAVPNTNVVSAPDQNTAVAQARDADAVVVVLGENPGAEAFADTEDPSLTPDQQSLVSAVQAVGKPVVVVLLTGRPRTLGAAGNANALLEAWLPGTEGGHAVADVLFGATNPSGKLAVSWPKSGGREPMSYDQLPGTNYGPDSNYEPAYPFGYGLSYTTFSTGAPTATQQVSPDGRVTVTFAVRNTGQRAGTATIPVYVHQPVSAVLVPDKRLVGFARVDLQPGQEKQATVTFDANRLAVTPGDVNGAGKPEVARGGYEAVVGDNKAAFTVK
jgi:beta-glucosidase